ncbi:MBL fold metallo-hydrolase [Arthrobacter sp. IK3]|uniref:MBL fold metallo-hydrolase n=1 Tax=Arthrobacter sp. IK3 TaxID=3448169 RepID=UPI003EE0E692
MIIRSGTDFTIVDGGYPSDLPLVLDSIKWLGLKPSAAAAMLITHAHTDHTGAASHFSREYDTPVLSSPGEHKSLLGEEKFQVTVKTALPYLWRPTVIRWALHAAKSGGTVPNDIAAAKVWTAEDLDELPGSPVAVMTPGHTPGHAAFHLPSHGVLISGDALVTGHAISRREGPQMLHPMFHNDLQGARSALDLLAAVDATVLLPGHGPGLLGTPAALVSAAQR